MVNKRAENLQLLNVFRQVVPQEGCMTAKTTLHIIQSAAAVQREVTYPLIVMSELADVCLP